MSHPSGKIEQVFGLFDDVEPPLPSSAALAGGEGPDDHHGGREPNGQVNERDIVRVLLPVLHMENPQADTLIACQRDICGRDGRVDVVVVNGSLSGFEIKSERDSLARLRRQVEVYSRALDFVSVVCASKHAAAALEVVPTWWGIREIVATDGALIVDEVRSARQNPNIQRQQLARLLTHDELYAELVFVRRIKRLSRARRAELADRLAQVTDRDELRQVVRDRLRQRPSWRAAAVRA